MSSSESSATQIPTNQFLHHWIPNLDKQQTDDTVGQVKKYLTVVLFERLSENGTFGTLTADEKTKLEGIKALLRHQISQQPDKGRVKYAGDIEVGIYSPDFNTMMIDMQKKVMSERYFNADKFLVGGKRKAKRRGISKRKKGKKSKAKTRKH